MKELIMKVITERVFGKPYKVEEVPPMNIRDLMIAARKEHIKLDRKQVKERS